MVLVKVDYLCDSESLLCLLKLKVVCWKHRKSCFTQNTNFSTYFPPKLKTFFSLSELKSFNLKSFVFLRCLNTLAVNYLHVCDLLDDFSINSSLMLTTFNCFFLPFLYWSHVSIIGLRITVSGPTNIFTACVVFWRGERHICHPTQTLRGV